MKRFKEFISEGSYPFWLKAATAAMVLKIRNLSKQIENEDDPVKQNKLISRQNNLLSYIDGLGIAVSTDDKKLMSRMKSIGKQS